MTNRPIIVASNRLLPASAARLQQAGVLRMPDGAEPMSADALAQALQGASAFVGFMTDRVDTRWLAGARSLRIVAAALKGYDNYDVPACTAAGVWLSIVPDLLTEPTAELALGLAISLARNLAAGDAHVRSPAFQGWRPTLYGRGLAGATVGVIGIGRVGRAIIDRLAGFGVARILGVDPHQQDTRAQPVELASAMRESDYLFVAAPLVPGSVHLVDHAALQQARPGQLIINIGRGSVVDEAAIADALAAGRIAGYAADVFEFEDWALPDRPQRVDPALLARSDTLFTPHLGSAVSSVRLAIEHRAIDNVLAVLDGQPPPDAVNRPLITA